MIKEHGLNEKGLKLHYLDKRNFSNELENMTDSITTNKILKKCLGKFKENKLIKGIVKLKLLRPSIEAKIGINAFYHPVGNFAVASKGKAFLMLHEIGHAIHANSFKYGKPLLIALGAIPGIAGSLLLTNAIKNELNDDYDKSLKNRVANFLEEHAPILTFAAFIPKIAEEGLASKRAISKASELLDKTKTIGLKKAYALGLASYIGVAITSALAMRLAIQDKKHFANEMNK